MYRLLSYLQTQKILPRMIEINHPSSCSSFQDRHKFTHTHTHTTRYGEEHIHRRRKKENSRDQHIFVHSCQDKRSSLSVCMRKKTATRQDK